MKPRVLALSKDLGSVQAITPVVCELENRPDCDVFLVCYAGAMKAVNEFDLNASEIDEAQFLRDPCRLISDLFENYQPNILLTGSSPIDFASHHTPEQLAIIEARNRGVPSFMIQDFWGMYAERFSVDGISLSRDLLPDCLCVLDKRAFEDLKSFGVPLRNMVVTHNPWLDRLARMTSELDILPTYQRKSTIDILLVSQPLSEMRHVRGWQYDQFDILKCLLDAISLKNEMGAVETNIAILPHPKENLHTWNNLVRTTVYPNVNLTLITYCPLELLSSVDYLVTSHSTLAYEALYFGTPCISLRPTKKEIKPYWIEESGLSPIFNDAESLSRYLMSNGPEAQRQKNMFTKKRLLKEGSIFSDGYATKKVLKELLVSLDNKI
jgi:hypothetical protein